MRTLTLSLTAAAILVLAACGGGHKSAEAAPNATAPAAHALPVASGPAAATGEAAIRRNLAQRMPNLPAIDEVLPAPVAGLYEVRVGSDILYTDASGNFLIQGEIFDTQAKVNVTQARLDKLSAIDFAQLPLKDAIAIKQGNGSRKMAVFVDPNCGYCKRFERDVAALKDVTVYTFLYPILGPDSQAKSRDIWCSKDPAKSWRDWMMADKLPTAAPANCDIGALTRNTALGRKHRVQGTPATVFVDGTRLPGAVSADRLEKQLAASPKS